MSLLTVCMRSEDATALYLERVRCKAAGCSAMFVCSDVASAADEAEFALEVRIYAMQYCIQSLVIHEQAVHLASLSEACLLRPRDMHGISCSVAGRHRQPSICKLRAHGRWRSLSAMCHSHPSLTLPFSFLTLCSCCRSSRRLT